MARTKNQRLIKRRINSKRTRRIRKRIRKNSKRRGIKRGRTRKFKGGSGYEEIKRQIDESRNKYIKIMEEFGKIKQELDKGNEALSQQFVNYKEIFDYLKDLLTMAYFKPEFETQLQSAKEIEDKLEKSREVNRILQDLQREWKSYQNQIIIQRRGEQPNTIVTPSNLESGDTGVPYVPPAETYTVSISLTNTEDCPKDSENKFCIEQEEEKTIGIMRVKLTKPQKISELNITGTTSPAIISFTFDSKDIEEYERFVRYVDDLLYTVFKDIIYNLFINEAEIDQAKIDDLSLITRGNVRKLIGRFGPPEAEAEAEAKEQNDREFFSSEIENEILINDICMELFGEALDQETQNDIKKIKGILQFVDKDIKNPRPKPSSIKKKKNSENMPGGGDVLKGLFSFGKGCLQGCGVLFGLGVGVSVGLTALCTAIGLGGAVGGLGSVWGIVGGSVAIVAGLISIILAGVFSKGKGTKSDWEAIGENIQGSGEILFSGFGLVGTMFDFFFKEKESLSGYKIGKSIVNFSLGND